MGVLYTIGYQDRQIDEFIDMVAGHRIEVVLDVRASPFSFKRGFNWYELKNRFNEIGVRYINVPSLGVPKDKRADFKTEYPKILEEGFYMVWQVIQIVRRALSVLVCYERVPSDCHRGILADYIKDKVFGVVVRHL
ncbi:MAG: DUF488 domain-containing protein [candidate division WOR-3 bacterium]